jgi:GT2 family glycosyltransferase
MIPVLIVPVLSSVELLYDMLESIDEPVETLIVVDNGGHVSRHRMAEINRACIGRRYVWKMPRNLGVPTSWNLGIKATPFALWWMIANFDVTFPAKALASFAEHSSPDRVVLSAASSAWCVFTIGENVVSNVGLFDEGIHPAYFEDADYLRRCTSHGVDVFSSGIRVEHKTSSTLESGFGDHNARTFGANEKRFKQRRDTNDLTSGEWSLATRRALTWD